MLRTLWLLCAGLRPCAGLHHGILGLRHTRSAVQMSSFVPPQGARVIIAEKNTPPLHDRALSVLSQFDESFATRVVTGTSESHTRVVLSPVGSLQGELDDIRKVGEAAAAGAAAAFAMGASKVTLEVDEAIEEAHHPVDGEGAYEFAALAAQLGVLQQAYVPLQAREATPPKPSALSELKLHPSGRQRAASAAQAIEAGRALARDIGAGDPERMAPLRLAELVKQACEAAGVSVSVIDELETLKAQYPLLMAVARASIAVKRHRPCVVRMEWSGRGEINRTLMIAGKGVTYDVGCVMTSLCPFRMPLCIPCVPGVQPFCLHTFVPCCHTFVPCVLTEARTLK